MENRTVPSVTLHRCLAALKVTDVTFFFLENQQERVNFSTLLTYFHLLHYYHSTNLLPRNNIGY